MRTSDHREACAVTDIFGGEQKRVTLHAGECPRTFRCVLWWIRTKPRTLYASSNGDTDQRQGWTQYHAALRLGLVLEGSDRVALRGLDRCARRRGLV